MLRLLARGLREPLLHFAVLGSAIFLIDAALAPGSDPSRQIEITAVVRDELVTSFQQRRGRPPSMAELGELIDNWVAQEVLYREGQALGLDQGDAIIRDRVVQRMTALVQNSAVVEPPSEAQLRAWFEAHRERFDRPARFDLLVKQVQGGEADASAMAAALRRAFETGEGALEPEEPLTYYQERPRPNLVALFGEDFVTALEGQPEFEWHALQSQQGWHLVRLDGFWPAEPARFGEAREAVAADWQRVALAEAAAKALRDMTAGYRIILPEAAESGARVDLARGDSGG